MGSRDIRYSFVWCLLVAAVAPTMACGGGSIAPIQVAAGCPEAPLRGPEGWASESGDRLIDDFESGDLFLPKLGGRTGAWILGTDGSSGVLTAEVSSACVARGAKSGHFSGSGFTSWGANWTAVLKNTTTGTAVPYDGQAYGGVSFWAAVGGSAAAPFDIPMGVTTMDCAWNSGMCTTCMDYYATTVTLTGQWRRVEMRFADLNQAGYGVPQIAMRRDQLVGLIMWPNHQFDIWIDDVRFEP